MHYYQFHVGDYLSSTSHLSNEEDLAYRRLLDMYYTSEKPIPLDTQWVSRRLRVATEVVELVLKDFFACTPDGYTKDRCEQEICRFKQLAERNKRNGSLGGRPKQNPVGSRSDTSGFPEEPSRNPNHEPTTKNHEPTTSNQEPKVKRLQAIACPSDVDQQVWVDWVQLRKTKRATVTQTVIDGARKEAEKAGMSLSEFLAVWCRRGSQGLEASWLKPSEIKPKADKYDWLRSDTQIIDME